MNQGSTPRLTWYAKGVTFYRTEPPAGLPRADTQVAAMFRLEDDEPPPAPLSAIPVAERTALLMSLASTLTRATYHFHRFASIVTLLAERRRAVGGLIVGDLLSPSALYEANAMLAGSRSFVDEVAYLAARRAGAVPDDADRKWTADTLFKADLSKSTKFNVAEVRGLQSRSQWFEELNAYRNVLTHRGWKDTPGAGYYPPGIQLHEASLPHMNIMLVPDLDSIGRPNRADSWRYTKQTRLEDLLQRLWTGLETFAMDVGAIWGFTTPQPGNVPLSEQPTLMVVEPLPSLVAAFGYTYAPLFSDPQKAEQFRERCFGAASRREILELQREREAPEHWSFHLPCGDSILPSPNVPLNDSLKVPLDPVYNATTGAILYTVEVASTSRSILRDFRGPYFGIPLTGQALSTLSALYYIRGAEP